MPFSITRPITFPAFSALAAALAAVIRRVPSPLQLGRPASRLVVGVAIGVSLTASFSALAYAEDTPGTAASATESAGDSATAPTATHDTLGPADSAAAHDTLVQQLIQQQHAAPLVADCAAHAGFVVPTSPIYDHVEFLPSAVDAQHASVEPWNQPFDDGKQRITVDTLVLVSGLGYRKGADQSKDPDLLKFRCGYVADKLLAFSYNEPYVYVKPHDEGGGSRHGRHATRGHHAASASRHGAHPTHGHTTAPGHHATPHGAGHKAPAKHKSTAH
jgi:hypothetical protein